MNSIRMAWDNIREKKGRSFLTMLGIIIGVSAVLILVAMVTGYNADVTSYYEKLGVNKVTIAVTQYDRTNTKDITDSLFSFVAKDLKNVALGVTPSISTTGTVKYSNISITTSTVYLGNEQFSSCSNYTLDKGRNLLETDIEQRAHVCVIGAYVANTLFQYASPIGKTIYFNGNPFEVVGVFYEKDGSAKSSMDDMVLLPYSFNRSLLSTSIISQYIVKVENSSMMNVAIAELKVFMADAVSTNSGKYTITNGNDELAATEGQTASLSLVLGGIAAIALLVGGIGIMNIMLVTVSERTREIGIKKSIGAQRSVIISQFLIESSFLSATGGVIGIILGYVVSLILGKAIYGLIVLPSMLVTIGAFVFSIIIGVGFGLYPAVKASGLQPVEALRAD